MTASISRAGTARAWVGRGYCLGVEKACWRRVENRLPLDAEVGSELGFPPHHCLEGFSHLEESAGEVLKPPGCTWKFLRHSNL